MTNEIKNPKEPLISILMDQKHACEKMLAYYIELEDKVPEEDLWQHERITPFYNDLQELVPGESQPVSALLDTAIQTIDEYLGAIESFTDDQLAAFFLGLGLTWLPISYWGIHCLYDYSVKIQKKLAYYEKLLLEKIPEEDHWQFEKTGIFNIPDLAVPDSMAPTKVLELASKLAGSMLDVLSDRPF